MKNLAGKYEISELSTIFFLDFAKLILECNIFIDINFQMLISSNGDASFRFQSSLNLQWSTPPPVAKDVCGNSFCVSFCGGSATECMVKIVCLRKFYIIYTLQMIIFSQQVAAWKLLFQNNERVVSTAAFLIVCLLSQ